MIRDGFVKDSAATGEWEAGAFRRRLMGRFAGVLFFASGLLGIVTLPLSPPDRNVPAIVSIALIAVVIGALAWSAPWHRWPRPATLWLVPPAFALIALANALGGSALYSYGVFFVITFVWIGVAHPPWTSVWMAPLAAVAFVLPLLYLPGDLLVGLGAGVLTIGVSVIVGELLGRGARALTNADEALRNEHDRFMSAISHELRTPITIARGHLDLVKDSPGSKAVRDAVEVVEDELDRMGRIVMDMTMLVRMEDPGFLRPEPIDLDDLVNTVAFKARPLLGDRLRVIEAPRPASATADPQRLTQALLNLLKNAATHPASDESVELRLFKESEWWRLEVADHGGGLPRGQEESLFEPLHTGPSSSAGEGLGLAIVRAISKAHGGTADVDNRPGEGATFWIRLPR